MKIKVCISVIVFLIISIISSSGCLLYAQFYQRADFGDSSITRKNQLGGYDYYDKNGNKAGYSKKTYGGDYIYYDNEGNKLGALKQVKGKNTYTFYSADNIATGILHKAPTGEYRYKDKFEGGLRSITPPPGEDIGFVPPSTFLEGTLKTQLEGSFEKPQEK